MIEVELLTVYDVAAVPPNDTAVAPVKFVPVIVTEVPPSVVPEAGETDVTTGAGGTVNVYWSPATVADVPFGLVTLMSTVPAACAGATAVIDVALFTVNDVAAVPPNETAVVPVKFVPVMVTLVPPRVVPLVGETEVIAGGWGATVNDAVAGTLVLSDVVSICVVSTCPIALAAYEPEVPGTVALNVRVCEVPDGTAY